MSTPRPHANSRDVTQEEMVALTHKSSLIGNLFPNTPRFTVIVAAAFPHDDVESGEEGLPVLESYLLFLRAVNIHTAIDIALTQTANMIREDFGDHEDLDFSMSVVGAFEGHLKDFSTSYDLKRSGLYDVDAVTEEYENGLDTHIG